MDLNEALNRLKEPVSENTYVFRYTKKKRSRELKIIIFATVINNAQNAYIYYDIVTRLKALFG
jgi:hypothetical protein